MSKIFLEILDPERQEIFKKISSFQDEGYLAGGTALALQIGHRTSYDFDIFINDFITRKLKDKISRIFGKVIYKWNTDEQVTFTVFRKDISITFVKEDFKPAFPLVKTSYMNLASICDIAADKAYVIGRRATWRDYADIFVLLERRLVTLEEIIKFAVKKYGTAFVELQLLEQLVYFEDLEQTPIEFIEKDYSYEQITSTLKRKVEEYVMKKIKSQA